MRLSVIIVSWNTRELLRRCLDGLREELRGIESEVFVVDNASTDDSAPMVASQQAWTRLIVNESNRGFAAANNQALRMARGESILLLNPDTQVQPGAIHALLRFLDERPSAGVVTAQLVNPDGSIQRSCRKFPTFFGMLYEFIGFSRLFPQMRRFREYKMLDWNRNDERQVDQASGACLLIRRAVIEDVGPLDEGFFMLFEEVDWCYRIREAGWEIWFTPSAKVLHHRSQSIDQVKARIILSSHRGLYRFWWKHHRRGHWYLDWLVHGGLMCLAYLRIAARGLRSFLRPKKPAERRKSTA